MRDAAEDFEDKVSEMKSYLNTGLVFQNLKEYVQAINAFKKLLQVAWHVKSTFYEMIAYNHMGVQYFYTGDIKKA